MHTVTNMCEWNGTGVQKGETKWEWFLTGVKNRDFSEEWL